MTIKKPRLYRCHTKDGYFTGYGVYREGVKATSNTEYIEATTAKEAATKHPLYEKRNIYCVWEKERK